MTTHTPAVTSEHVQQTMMPSPMRKYVTEAVGTFLLVFTVGAAVRGGSALAPLAIGATLMVMIYAGGHISGAHYNPAVTLAVLVRGRIGWWEALRYWVAQLFGGLVAAALVTIVIAAPADTRALAFSGHAVSAALLAESVFTFALCFVVLNVATSRDHEGNGFYGLAIGFTVTAGAIAVGGISGGAFNPAVVAGGIAMGMFAASTLWVFLVAQIAAGALAGIMFRLLNPDDK